MVKKLPSSAGDMGSIPAWGTKIPHGTGQRSPGATVKSLHATAKTQCCQIYLYMFKSHLCTGLDKGIDSSSSGKPMAQTDTHFHKVGMFE